MTRSSPLVLAFALLACGTPSALRVQIATDLSPGRDFDAIDVALTGPIGGDASTAVVGDRSWSRPTLLHTFEGLGEGRYHVALTVRRGAQVVQVSSRVVNVAGQTIVTLRVTGDCGAAVCATDETCIADTCVSDSCTPETPESCPTTCDPAACTSPIACVSAVCAPEGVCFAETHDELCGAGQLCDATRGCIDTCAGSACAPTVCSWSPIPTFDSLRRVDELDTTGVEVDPFVTRDSAQLYFAHADTSDSGSDLFIATRMASGVYGMRTMLPFPLSSPANDGGFDLFQHGARSEQWVASARAGGGTSSDLYVVRNGAAVIVTELSTMAQEEDPRLTADGLSIYFTRLSGGASDILRADRASLAAPFGTPVVVAATGIGHEADPTISADGLTLVFTADVGGGNDLYVVSRATIEAPFGTPVAITAVNTGADESQGFLRGDGCELWFSRDADLWVATATPDR